MANTLTARLMGDPPFRADAYAEDKERIERELAAQQERGWRAPYRNRIRRELVSAKPPPVEQQVRDLWDAQTPIGTIAERLHLTLGQVYEMVSTQ